MFKQFKKAMRFKKWSQALKMCVRFKNIFARFKNCSQDSKNVLAIQKIERFQKCSGALKMFARFRKRLVRFKNCSHESQNVQAIQKDGEV
jgi:hypothetical protein